MSKIINTQFHIRGIHLNDHLRHRLKGPLERLQNLTPVSGAAVVVEYERHNAPPFRACALLAVPGPDIHAEARDHTLDAAWLKVTTALRKQIEQRKFRQATRMKSKGRLRAPAIPRARGAAPLRG